MKASERRFFDDAEWVFLRAACDRLIPADGVGPGALELGVPEFIDEHMTTPYANGSIWYRSGPFVDAGPEFGYQGGLCLSEILRAGIAATEGYCASNYAGRAFAQLNIEEQEAVLRKLESGDIAFTAVPARHFFRFLLQEVRLGYFADPAYGGNRGMGAWKMIGYPGMVSDYRDWIGVHDRPYDGEPISLAERGSTR